LIDSYLEKITITNQAYGFSLFKKPIAQMQKFLQEFKYEYALYLNTFMSEELGIALRQHLAWCAMWLRGCMLAMRRRGFKIVRRNANSYKWYLDHTFIHEVLLDKQVESV
jgi:hypothetical protein